MEAFLECCYRDDWDAAALAYRALPEAGRVAVVARLRETSRPGRSGSWNVDRLTAALYRTAAASGWQPPQD